MQDFNQMSPPSRSGYRPPTPQAPRPVRRLQQGLAALVQRHNQAPQRGLPRPVFYVKPVARRRLTYGHEEASARVLPVYHQRRNPARVNHRDFFFGRGRRQAMQELGSPEIRPIVSPPQAPRPLRARVAQRRPFRAEAELDQVQPEAAAEPAGARPEQPAEAAIEAQAGPSQDNDKSPVSWQKHTRRRLFSGGSEDDDDDEGSSSSDDQQE